MDIVRTRLQPVEKVMAQVSGGEGGKSRKEVPFAGDTVDARGQYPVAHRPERRIELSIDSAQPRVEPERE